MKRHGLFILSLLLLVNCKTAQFTGTTATKKSPNQSGSTQTDPKDPIENPNFDPNSPGGGKGGDDPKGGGGGKGGDDPKGGGGGKGGDDPKSGGGGKGGDDPNGGGGGKGGDDPKGGGGGKGGDDPKGGGGKGGDDPNGGGGGKDDPNQSDDNDNPNQGSHEPIFSECGNHPERKLVAGLYVLSDSTKKLPDFSKLSKKKDICLRQLDIEDRDFKEGFPGVENLVEWFGLDIRFKVNIPKTGDYKFTLVSDDGSRLYIDGKEIIDNDGLHLPETESKTVKGLSKGWHDFRVKYFQGPRYNIALELFWTPPGSSSKRYIPVEYFARP